MKPLSLLLPAALFLCSCRNSAKPPVDPNSGKKLVSYASRYIGASTDTLLPGGAYVHFLVNTDTADQTLYIRYGRPGFERTYEVEEGIAAGNCHNLEFEYGTSNTLALMYECMNSRAVLLLPLSATDSARYVNPLYVSLEDSLMLVRAPHYGPDETDSLTAADLDFKQKTSFRLRYITTCSDLLVCFDTIYFDKKLIMRYLGSDGETDPEPRMQTEVIDWKK